MRLVIDGREIPNALQVPRQAVFEKNGKTFVYLRRSAIGSSGATSRSPTAPRAAPRSQASNDGDVIALIDPDVAAQRTKSSSSRAAADGVGSSEVSGARTHLWSTDFLPELMLGLENLRAHKLRSLLTMLGMIFGVAAVVAMLSIGAGAQQEVMAFIEQLGVRNLIVEAREAADEQSLQKVRKLSPGLSFKDLRVIQANLDDISAVSARKRFTPTKLLPRPIGGDMPTVYGVSPAYTAIGNLRVASGRFFDRRRRRGARRRWRCWARPPPRRCSAPTIRSASSSRSTSSGFR